MMNDDINVVQVVGSTARTEHVQFMNGNAETNHSKPSNKYFNNIYTDKKTGEEAEINAQAPMSPYSYKYICHMQDKPVNWDQVQSLDPMLRATKGLYMIKYTPIHSGDYRKGRPFKIGQDLIRWDIRVSGPKEWNELCDRVIEFGWIRRNSFLTDGMFRLAKLHPGMSFWFSVKWLEYEAKLQAQQDTETKPSNAPLVSRKTSIKEYKNINESKDKKIVIRYFNDILKEINEAESLPSVQEEMCSESGEKYIRGRNTVRDPVTGQFLKKEQWPKKKEE